MTCNFDKKQLNAMNGLETNLDQILSIIKRPPVEKTTQKLLLDMAVTDVSMRLESKEEEDRKENDATSLNALKLDMAPLGSDASFQTIAIEDTLRHIESYFDDDSRIADLRSLACIEWKLGELIATIECDDRSNVNAKQKWNCKIRELIAKYQAAHDRLSRSSATNDCLLDSKINHKNDSDHHRPTASLSSSIENGKKPASTIADMAHHASGEKDQFKAARERIIAAFRATPSVNCAVDMVNIRKLVIVLSKSKKLIDSLLFMDRNTRKWPMMDEIYMLAKAKLPATLVPDRPQHQTPTYPAILQDVNKNSFALLFDYLLGLIQAEADNRTISLRRNVDEFSALFNCNYCRSTGHQVSSCPSRHAKFCKNCHTFGHSAKRCSAPAISANNIQFL